MILMILMTSIHLKNDQIWNQFENDDFDFDLKSL